MKTISILYCVILLGYILGVHNGQIALIKDDDVVEVYPRSVSTLPPADQKLLEQGLPIESQSQLTMYLEDYFS